MQIVTQENPGSCVTLIMTKGEGFSTTACVWHSQGVYHFPNTSCLGSQDLCYA